LVGWGAIYWFFGLMFGVGTYQKYTQHIGVFVTAKSFEGPQVVAFIIATTRSVTFVMSTCVEVRFST